MYNFKLPPLQEISYNFLMISDGTKRSSTCFLKYRSPITWYRQVQRQIVRFQSEHRFCFSWLSEQNMRYFEKHVVHFQKRWKFDICDSLGGVKIFEIWHVSHDRLLSPHDQPMIALWLSTTKWKTIILVKCFRSFKNPKNV